MTLTLPIDPLLPDLKAQLRQCNCLVLEAPPGSGKTTRVPPALLDDPGEIIVLEPRRLAARLAARRVAAELGERLGQTVGYQVRFDEVSSAATRLRFVTEGILTRRLLSDPSLRAVSTVILDEFHERHLQADLALALLRRLQLNERPDLRLIVMSATLAVEPIREFLGNCPVLRAEGRRFEVAVDYLPRPDDRPLEQQVAAALQQLIKAGLDGDVLVFLPGAAEIRRAREACAGVAQELLIKDLLILPLHGDLPLAEQDRAIQPAAQHKVILATNVAESSITIEGITAVIDSGLARIAGHSAWSGLPTLKVARISRAAAVQRAGRAGRTRPGRCFRLYTQADFEARPAQETAEIHRVDLTEPLLELHALGDTANLAWLEAPPESARVAAEDLLTRLGALAQGKITAMGARMLQLSTHPRQARLIIEAGQRGLLAEGCQLAALIGERDIRSSARGLLTTAPPAVGAKSPHQRSPQTLGPSDLLLLLDAFAEAAKVQFSVERLRAYGLDPFATQAVERVRAQLTRQAERLIKRNPAQNQQPVAVKSAMTARKTDQALLISILAGYPDRVARARAAGDRIELLMASGGTAQLAESSVVRKAELLVAIDAEERETSTRNSGRTITTLVRLASEIKADWLLDLFIDQIQETSELCWQPQSERVESIKRLMYDQLIIDESRVLAGRDPAAAAVLAEAALAVGVENFIEREQLDRWLARIDFVAGQTPEAGFVELDEAAVGTALKQLCQGKSSFAELRAVTAKGGLIMELQQQLSAQQRRLLSSLAPERVTIGGGRQVTIRYEAGRPPWLASRLQDFFGMAKGPTIADGRVPVVLHLLAPNQRAVQVTTDLAGFWTRTYPQVRKELSRRYPRHAWPEDPLKAISDKR